MRICADDEPVEGTVDGILWPVDVLGASSILSGVSDTDSESGLPGLDIGLDILRPS